MLLGTFHNWLVKYAWHDPQAGPGDPSNAQESNGLYKLRHLDISGIRISSATMSALCHSVHVHPAIRCCLTPVEGWLVLGVMLRLDL